MKSNDPFHYLTEQVVPVKEIGNKLVKEDTPIKNLDFKIRKSKEITIQFNLPRNNSIPRKVDRT